MDTIKVLSGMIDQLLRLKTKDEMEWVVDSLYNIWHRKQPTNPIDFDHYVKK